MKTRNHLAIYWKGQATREHARCSDLQSRMREVSADFRRILAESTSHATESQAMRARFEAAAQRNRALDAEIRVWAKDLDKSREQATEREKALARERDAALERAFHHETLCLALGWKLPLSGNGSALRVTPVDPRPESIHLGTLNSDRSDSCHPSNIARIVYSEIMATHVSCDLANQRANEWMSKAVALNDAIEFSDAARMRLATARAATKQNNSDDPWRFRNAGDLYR